MNRLIRTAIAILYIASSFKFAYARDDDDSNDTIFIFLIIGVIIFCQWFEQSLKSI